ncbi:MAG: biotin--[acetyl-CoA-carboxylase] ligase [Actinomycetota bacterium]|nr:biotin--[acetyl-CoA-carboxylase] ligase [Actinomycetota bacterium]
MRRFAEVDSTNRYLLDEAAKGAREGLVVLADLQLAGRGRMGRRWESRPGASLLVSVLLRPSLPAVRLHLAVACMALAAVEACADVAGARPRLKWPNDLVLGPAEDKLGGILAEVDLPAVVVGLGLNLDWPPGTLPTGAVGLGPVDRDALLDALLAHLGSLYGDWPRVWEEYRAACVTIGRAVRVEMSDGAFTGTAVAVSDEGQLVVSPTDGGARLRTVAAGDVVHLRPGLPD